MFGAYYTNIGNPFWCFEIISFWGLACALSGFLITQKLEKEGDVTVDGDSEIEEMNFCQRINYGYRVCKNALREPTMYMTMLFFVVEGFTVPHFFEFFYYYAMNEIGMT